MPDASPRSDPDPARGRDGGSVSNQQTPEEGVMVSQLTEAMIINGVVLATVLASDLGGARKIGLMRVLRPVVAAAVIVPLFVKAPATHGASLGVELAGVAAGVLGGMAAVALMKIYRSPASGSPVSRAGWPYAIF